MFMGIALLPMLIVNYTTHNQFILTAGVGFNLWMGNNPESTGTYDLSTFPDKDRSSLSGVNQNQMYTRKAISFIINNPLDFIVLYFKKYYYFGGQIHIS